jgi:hypothetical protein
MPSTATSRTWSSSMCGSSSMFGSSDGGLGKTGTDGGSFRQRGLAGNCSVLPFRRIPCSRKATKTTNQCRNMTQSQRSLTRTAAEKSARAPALARGPRRNPRWNFQRNPCGILFLCPGTRVPRQQLAQLGAGFGRRLSDSPGCASSGFLQLTYLTRM